ncbi:hypothetical protein JCM19237_5529 [Photobacterium aphoticum]|uniref:Methyltransferase type 11 domain-containing protein n=1 Tax=Photobacterium aphoticum TaxID=754436 RepID=A0A090QI83_9GAMM|nr:hypothetical protein JCM19237_5529 [Photobacterium aphoticum]
MSDQYNQAVSTHYAAYRPPLHQRILSMALPAETFFHCGVDIGCGTGVSTNALHPYCYLVHGIEPSEAMLAQATPLSNMHYHLGTGEAIPLPDGSVDVVTFAGSLCYAKSPQLVKELVRVCSPKASIVVYDFEVLLNNVMASLGVDLPSSKIPSVHNASSYDHAINFHGESALDEQCVHHEHVAFSVSAEQLAHVLFSSSKRYALLVEQFANADDIDAFTQVVKMLEQQSSTHSLQADIYYSVYGIKQTATYIATTHTDD